MNSTEEEIEIEIEITEDDELPVYTNNIDTELLNYEEVYKTYYNCRTFCVIIVFIFLLCLIIGILFGFNFREKKFPFYDLSFSVCENNSSFTKKITIDIYNNSCVKKCSLNYNYNYCVNKYKYNHMSHFISAFSTIMLIMLIFVYMPKQSDNPNINIIIFTLCIICAFTGVSQLLGRFVPCLYVYELIDELGFSIQSSLFGNTCLAFIFIINGIQITLYKIIVKINNLIK
jgi:hypothetical protein